MPPHNDGIEYLLCAIDVWSRRAWVRPMRSKTGAETLDTLRRLVEEIEGCWPHKRILAIVSDQGTEFMNAPVQQYLRQKGIRFWPSYSFNKAPHVERFQQTLKKYIYSYMTQQETYRYVDKLDAIMETYNNRPHRSLGYMTPMFAEREMSQQMVALMANKRYQEAADHADRPKLAVGNRVRKWMGKGAFKKGHEERFSRTMYEVVEVLTNLPRTRYRIKNMDTGKMVKRRYLAEQLQRLTGDVYKVKEVKRGRVHMINGRRHLLVEFKYFPSKLYWIPETDITHDYRATQVGPADAPGTVQRAQQAGELVRRP